MSHPPQREHSPKDRDNLQRVLTLLNESNANQRVTAAEICRELGDFELAAKLLDFSFPWPYQPAVQLIKNLAQQKDAEVHELK